MKEENKKKGSIDPVTIEDQIKILNQLMNCVCKISFEGRIGTGFFCKIPFRKEILKVLISSSDILCEDGMEDIRQINLSLNDEKEKIILDTSIFRFCYIDDNSKIAMLELDEKDNIKNYLELDNNLFQLGSQNNYINKSIYLLHYLGGKNANISFGLIENIIFYNIHHNCWIDKYSSGSPILNLQSKKVIGIHTGSSVYFNIGTFLKNPLQNYFKTEEKV